MRIDASALTIPNLLKSLQQKLGADEAAVPRQQKLPGRLDELPQPF